MKDLGENEKKAKMGVRSIIMRKVKWTLIDFAYLHGERHGESIHIFFFLDTKNWTAQEGNQLAIGKTSTLSLALARRVGGRGRRVGKKESTKTQAREQKQGAKCCRKCNGSSGTCQIKG